MSQSEVFRPSNGSLIAGPGPLTENYMASIDSFRKDQRPSTQGGYRFGQLSHNSFFTRHNPHPARVRHIKGLLDVPICAVNDDGYFSNPKYSLQFPPNAFDSSQVSKFKGKVPVNAINVNSQLHPINTVTGLQYFNGLQSYPWREKAVPKVGLVPVTEAWRDELAQLTKNLGFNSEVQQQPSMAPERPKTKYSAETGRLIPPPSRAMSRGHSRQASRQGRIHNPLNHIAAEPDMESMVMTMLCQILQTEDINAVQAWLVSAGEREKTMVLDMIRSALSAKEDYYQRDYNPEFVDSSSLTKLPPINEGQNNIIGDTESEKQRKIDRLVLDEPSLPGEPANQDMWMRKPKTPQNKDGPLSDIKPPVSEAFKPKQPSRPPTNSGRTAKSPGNRPGSTFKYTSVDNTAEQTAPKESDIRAKMQVTSPNTF